MTTTADEAYLYVLVCIHLIWNIFFKTFLNYSQKPLHVSLIQFFTFSVFRIKKKPFALVLHTKPSFLWMITNPMEICIFFPSHTFMSSLKLIMGTCGIDPLLLIPGALDSWSVPQLLDTRLFLLRVHYDDDDYSLPPTLLTSAFPSFCVSGGSLFWGVVWCCRGGGL